MTRSILYLFLLISGTVFSQNEKGRVYVMWGWNRALYTDSDIKFQGEYYSITLHDVEADDRQSTITADTYLNPINLTIPQTNFRVGYFFRDKWSVSLGFDHMKYVMVQDQTVQIDGHIIGSGTEFDGVYDNEPIVLTKDFLTFEHTNGLNYINLELNRHWNLFNHEGLNMQVNPLIGAGAGVLFPRTASKFLDNELADEFHVAGYGLAAKVGLNINIFKYVSLQSELKGGYINMPDVRTTNNPNDIAKQHFFFTQWNFMLGATFPLFPEKE